MIFWAALFFSPLISVVAFIQIILMFYFKKISALRFVNSSFVESLYFYCFDESKGLKRLLMAFPDPLNFSIMVL